MRERATRSGRELASRCRITALVVALTACASDRDASPSVAHDAGPDGPAEGAAPPIDLDAISQRPLDTLSNAEAQAVCEEDVRRSDRCVELGIATTETPAECDEFVATCHAGQADQDPATLCRGMSFGPSGTCSVSVEAFFRCMEARNANVNCSEAGYIMDVPESCTRVVADCPQFSPLFPQYGRPHPCDPDAGTDRPPDTDPDIFGSDGCRPSPARLVFLGDSITDTPEVRQSVADRLRPLASPDLVVESFAVSGTKVGALPGQARRAAPGPGHVFVWMWSIANDMLTGIVTDPNADLGPLRASFEEVFGYFGDASLFPDGATFLLNTQYWPFDLCDVPGSQRDPGPVLRDRFLQINRIMFLDVAEARPDTVAIDHYPDFLGHVDNANVRGCPYCGADNTPWTFARHPSEAGSAHIAEKWAAVFERMLGSSCRP